jgi:copper chaperone CopZ
MASVNLTVKGMHCKSCKMLVEDALEEGGMKNIKVDLNEKEQIGKISFDGDKEKAKTLIEDEGYKVV